MCIPCSIMQPGHGQEHGLLIVGNTVTHVFEGLEILKSLNE